MKPLLLEIEGFKSYKDKQSVDFEQLGQGGIFGVFGRTGSGKSSILDAMMFALFGPAVKELGGQINSVSQNARVTFRFSMLTQDGRKTFEAMRSLARSKDGSVNTSGCRFLRRDGDTETVLASEKIELVNAAIQDVLKLGREEFSKTVVLPQGQFAEFLRLKPAERNVILEKLFSLGGYGTRLEERAKRERDMLQERIRPLEQTLGECAAATDDALAAKAGLLKAGIAEKDARSARAKAAEKALRESEQAFNNTSALDKLEEQSKELKAREKETAVLKAAYQLAKKAEIAAPLIRSLQEREKELADARTEKSGQEKLLQPAQARTKAALERYAAAKASFEAEDVRLGQLAGLLKDYIGNTETGQQHSQSAGKAKSEALSAESSHLLAEEKVRKLEAELASAKEHNFAIFEARKLADGSPCPVCGAIQHPRKAVGSFLDAAAMQDTLEKAREQARLAKAERDKLSSVAQTLAGIAEEKKDALEKLHARLCSIAPEAWALDLQKARQLHEEKTSLQKQISREHSAAFVEKEQAEKEYNAVSQAFSLALNSEKHCLGNVQKAQAALGQALAESGFASDKEALAAQMPREEMERIRTVTEAYEREAAGLEAKLDEARGKVKQRVSEEQFHTAIAEHEEAKARAAESIENAAKLEAELDAMKRDNMKLKKAQEAFRTAEKAAADVDDLLKAIRGKAFVEFAAGRMMEEIVYEASHHLQKLAYGRYEFFYDPKEGFLVRDNYNGGIQRSASTLSGGETFLVSLTLALALASHISRQRHPFEFFFLDEGFGTLDAGLLETVMDALETLRGANLTIGLITHNEDIQRRIYSKLLVEQPDPLRGTQLHPLRQ